MRPQNFIPCHIKALDPVDNVDPLEAARVAVAVNPINSPNIDDRRGVDMSPALEPARISVLTQKYWGAKGVKLTVSFVEEVKPGLRDKILAYMNKWADHCNASFVWTKVQGNVRVSFGRTGHWSYLGTDVLSVAPHRATMNLQGFTLKTPDSEFDRVVVHEAGHTLGCPHEHMRKELVDRLDRAKTIEYFRRTQGWDEATTVLNVLTPLEENSLTGASPIDDTSVMCYQLPGSITTDGRPVPGGSRLNATDGVFMGRLYPKAADLVVSAPAPADLVTVDQERKVVHLRLPAGWSVKMTT